MRRWTWKRTQLTIIVPALAQVYGDASKELQATIDEYFDGFAKRDEEMKSLIGTVVNGCEWTEEDYRQWRLNNIGRGKRYEAMRDTLTERMTAANEVAISYVNDATPGIYSLNRNFAAYEIDRAMGLSKPMARSIS